MKIGYTRGYEAGVAAASERYERQVALLTEQLADARANAEAANSRADATFDQLMLRIGSQPVSLAATTERREVVQKLMDRHGVVEADAFEEYPLGDPRGRYKDADAARIGDDA